MRGASLVRVAWFGWLCVAAIGGCTGCPSPASSDAGIDAGAADAGGGDAGPFVVGAQEPYPTVPWNGGSVLGQPNLVTITYDTDLNASTREAFDDWVLTSQWYQGWSGEYGVGPGTHIAKVHWSGSPPAQLDETTVGSMLLDAVTDGGLPWSPDGGTLYALYLPTGPTLTFFCRQVCDPVGTDFVGGYHWEAQRNGVQISYAVVPTCSGGGNTESQGQVEFSASHEIAEAATDPFPGSSPAYAFYDSTSPWAALGGEVGDLCAGEAIDEGGHHLQRVWSNNSAADGGAPCVPAFQEPYYSASATPTTIQSVVAGQYLDFTIQAWSSAPAQPWSLSTATLKPPPCIGAADAGIATFAPTLTWSGSVTVENGQTRSLRVGVPANAPSGSAAFLIVISSRGSSDFSFWPLLIEVQ